MRADVLQVFRCFRPLTCELAGEFDHRSRQVLPRVTDAASSLQLRQAGLFVSGFRGIKLGREPSGNKFGQLGV